ncbi:MAG: heparan-alpha-glucosaminide N-acetyltransferase domain-containing protein [Terricaulis sp.]
MPTRERVLALDVLRGLAVAGMILVTSPGDWNTNYAPLRHADWDGWTPTDMIFPAFLFAVGMALGLPFPQKLEGSAAVASFWSRIARRVAALIALGLALELVAVGLRALGAPGIGEGDLAHMRIPGVLQRIALCYGAAAALIFVTGWRSDERAVQINPRAIAVVIGVLLIGYWALMRFVPVPGFGAGHLDPEGNLAAFLDRSIFTSAHLWPIGSVAWGGPIVYDPEGLLSTLPALTNTLFGVLAAWAWKRDADKALFQIAVAGAVLIVLGLALDPLFPINKRIWTSTFAMLSSGVSALALVFLALVLRADVGRRLGWPFRILGSNAILAFVISILYSHVRGIPFLDLDGAKVGTQKWGNDVMLRVLPDPYLASLANALAAVFVVTMLLWWLDQRRIYLRV